jgi:hypothetical protein
VSNPLSGASGLAIFRTWVATALDGDENAVVYVATPADGVAGAPAEVSMRAVASNLGLDPEPDIDRLTPARHAHIELRAGGWTALLVRGETVAEVPVQPHWQEVAGRRQHAVVILSYKPLPAGVDAGEHATASASERQVVMGTVPVA